MRLNVYLPDDLGEKVRSEMPDLNLSGLLQQALRQALDCAHERWVCADCGEDVDTDEVCRGAMKELWDELWWSWEPLVDRRGTAEGAAKVGRDVAVRMGVPGAAMRPLLRPTRAMREAG
jgi:hypothetical protein